MCYNSVISAYPWSIFILHQNLKGLIWKVMVRQQWQYWLKIFNGRFLHLLLHMRCLLFTWEAVWGDGTKHDDLWFISWSSSFLNVEAARTGALTSGKPPSDCSLLPEPACTTSRVPFLLAPADDIIFSIKTYRAFDIRTAPSRRHRGSNKEQATITDSPPTKTPNPDVITGGLDSRAVHPHQPLQGA